MVIQSTTDDWLTAEEQTFKNTSSETFEQLQSLKLVPSEITEVDIDFSKPFNKWRDEENNTMKAIIPVISKGVKMNFWLNTKNPLYADIIRAGKAGQTNFKILQTGIQKNTRYTLVK